MSEQPETVPDETVPDPEPESAPADGEQEVTEA